MFMRTVHARKRQVGITLVELMVALTLGLIVIGTASQVFVANKRTYRLSQALARVQENGRFAMQSIARDIRMAGLSGCMSRLQLEVKTVATNAPAVDFGQAVLGFDSSTGWWTSTTAPQTPFGDNIAICDAAGGASATCQVSDAIQIVRGAASAATLSSAMATSAAAVQVTAAEFNALRPRIVPADANTTQEDLVLITDCGRADLFRASTVGTAAGGDWLITPNAALQKSYSTDAVIQPLVGASYFIGDPDDGRTDPVGALYRIGFTDEGVTPVALPMAEGVEMMRISYGEDTGGDEFADMYVNAAGVTDWSRVVSVRVGLLVKSKEDFVTDVPTPITFAGVTVNNGANADRRLRLVFSQTIGLRNRVP